METPPQDYSTRRFTRNALVEIPARMGALSVTDNRNNVRLNGRGLTNLTNLLVDVSSPNIPSSLVSPAPSPDELVIAQRGRRRFPVTWSPEVEAHSSPSKERTPVKTPSSIVLRSTPRKRLLLSDCTDSPSPEKRKNMSPNIKASPGVKRLRSDRPHTPLTGSVNLALRVFSKEQLIDILQNLISTNPILEEHLKQNLPAPDMRYFKDKLNELRRNIFKALPSSRLSSKTDSPAYTRASTHVLAFKKELLEQGKVVASSQQWEYVVEHALMAWEAAAGTPVWDNPPHNAPRRHCFKFLASQISTALRSSTHWTQEQLDGLTDKVKSFVADSEDIVPCLKLLESMGKRK